MEKYQSIVNDIHSRSPRDKCGIINNISTVILRPIGCAVLDRDFKPNALTWILGLLIIDVLSLTFYAIYYYRQQYMFVLEVLITSGISIPNSISYLRVAFYYSEYQSLILFGSDYTLANNDPGLEVVLDLRATRFLNNMVKLFVILCASLASFVLYPVYAYFVLNEQVYIIKIILPFLDPDTSTGFYVNTANQLTLSFFGVLGSIGVELINCIMINNLRAGVDVVSSSCRNLSSIREYDANARKMLRTIFTQVQDLDRYIMALNEFFYWRFLVQPSVLTFSISASIFCIKAIDYKSGYGFGIFLYFQVLILCFMGSEVKEANDQLQESFYGISWYKLPPKEQMMIAHLLNRLQNGARLTIGPFAALDYEITAKITSAIYNYTALLFSLL